MNREKALEFLRNHQPLPSDGELTQEIIDQYDIVRRYFIENPDSESICLFLNSFGEGNGFGVYQLVEDVILVHDPEDVIPCLKSAIISEKSGVRYWSTQIAANFSDERLLESLQAALIDKNVDTREAAITALEVIGGESVEKMLKDRLVSEHDPDIRVLIKEVLSSI